MGIEAAVRADAANRAAAAPAGAARRAPGRTKGAAKQAQRGRHVGPVPAVLNSLINGKEKGWQADCSFYGMISSRHETDCRMRPPILIVLHGELSTPGRVAIQLRNRDIPLDVRRPRFGDDLPETLEQHTGAVIFGGPQSANDDDEIVKREIEWIGVVLKEKKPFLGICLGG